MYYSKQEDRYKVVLFLQVALPFKLEVAEARVVMLNASEPKIECKNDKIATNTVCTRSGVL